KGFLLNFVNFGVLAGWIGTLIMANALTTSDNGVMLFIATVLITFFVTDLLKILLAKRLRKKMTPRFIFKTKKWMSILILGFGILLLIQGIFPKGVEAGLERIPGQSHPLERPIPPVEEQQLKNLQLYVQGFRGIERIRTAVAAFAELSLASRPRYQNSC